MRFPVTAASKTSDCKRYMPTPWSTLKSRRAGKSGSVMNFSAYDIASSRASMVASVGEHRLLSGSC